MSAGDLAAIIVTAVAICAVGALVWMVISLRSAIDDLREIVTETRDQLLPATERIEGAVQRTEAELHRADGLLETAESVSARADAVSRATYRAVADPVIRTAAVLKGTRHATRRLRRGSADGSSEAS